MKKFGSILLATVCAIVPATGYGQDSAAIRPYVTIRAGGSYYDKPDQGAGLTLVNPSQYPFQHVSFGANLSAHWGAELAVDFVETNILATGVDGRIGEYATWSLLPLVRYRYPLFNKMLVPYVVAGVGIGIGEFNDRNAANSNIRFGGSQDVVPIYAVGAGLEYFLNENAALGVEAKHVSGFKTDISYLGQNRTFDNDQTLVSVGLRLFLDNPAAGDPRGGTPAPVNYSQARQFYTAFRTGGAVFTGADDFAPLTLQNPERVFFGAAAGYSFNNHWGFEVGGDYWEPNLSAPGVGVVGEYALWTLLAHVRYRVPVGNGRLVPYALVGGGLGWSQANDRHLPSAAYPLVQETHTSLVGSVGGGIEYMLNRNVAIGIESRYIFGFNNDVTIGTTKGTLDNNSLLILAQLRVLFP